MLALAHTTQNLPVWARTNIDMLARYTKASQQRNLGFNPLGIHSQKTLLGLYKTILTFGMVCFQNKNLYGFVEDIPFRLWSMFTWYPSITSQSCSTGFRSRLGRPVKNNELLRMFMEPICFKPVHLSLTIMPWPKQDHSILPILIVDVNITRLWWPVSVWCWYYALHCCLIIGCWDNCRNEQMFLIKWSVSDQFLRLLE